VKKPQISLKDNKYRQRIQKLTKENKVYAVKSRNTKNTSNNYKNTRNNKPYLLTRNTRKSPEEIPKITKQNRKITNRNSHIHKKPVTHNREKHTTHKTLRHTQHQQINRRIPQNHASTTSKKKIPNTTRYTNQTKTK